MTPSQLLDATLNAWRAKLPSRYTPEYIDGFIARNRDRLLRVVEHTLNLTRLRRGGAPKTPDDFLEIAALVDRERKTVASKTGDHDPVVLVRLQQRLTRLLERDASPEGQEAAARVLRTYVDLRAEALLLRAQGWQAEPLLLRRPALALLAGDGRTVVAFRDAKGLLHLNPAYTDAAALRATADAAHQRVTQLRDRIADGAKLDRYANALWTHARAAASPPTPPRDLESPPDLKDKPWRTEANLQAMRLVLAKEPGEMTSEDLQILARYSGWGGLSIDKVRDQVPPDLVPESFGLIHEYYTPTLIAESLAELLCPFLPELAGNDGIVRALEPSAGIGRLLRAFNPRRCLALEAGGQIKKIEWTAVEFSKVSSTLLRALRCDIDVFHMPFERWIRDDGPRYHGTLGLIVSNPPYGERGAMAREDPDDFYKEKRAYAYFMRRALDLLIPGGIGVFLIPAGLLSGNLNRGLREKLLLRHHLLGAYRLPSHDPRGRETVPGASVVMDIVFWRSRGGELREVDEADTFILDGDYFSRHRDQILGEEDGAFAGDEETGKTRSWRYKVTGTLEKGLPPLDPRPICTSCVLTSIVPRDDIGTFQSVLVDQDEAIPDDVDPDLHPALELGRRVNRYLAALGADDADKAAALWPELHAALETFAKAHGNPWKLKGLRQLGDRGIAPAAHLLGAFTQQGAIVQPLREPPRVQPKYTGQPGDIVAQAELLFRQRRDLTVDDLLAFHREQGGTLDHPAALKALFQKSWNLDGEAWDHLLPEDAYLTGNTLWERHDRAQARAAQGDLQARSQVTRLLAAIRPAVFDDLTDLAPNQGWIPLDLVAGWLSEQVNARYGAIVLERAGGLVEASDQGERALAPEAIAFLGWMNHDLSHFTPPKREKRDRDAGPRTREEKAAAKQTLADERLALQKKWSDSFRTWIASDDARQARIVHAYNRSFRGRIVPDYSSEPLTIARWGPAAPQLKPHQIAGARRVLAQRGGLVAFDVGVGKTYTALAIIARARQEGWVRRPVILVPGSLVWKWHDDILCTLPDYRVAVIGSKRKRLGRGARKGLVTSEPDTPQERSQKWIALQTGQLDVVVLAYEALGRTKMNTDVVMAYIDQVEAIERSLTLRRRALEEQAKTQKGRDKLSERELALLEHGTKAWVEEILALPQDWEYDPGVAWDEIGIDMLVVDEAAAFKNLYLPQAREDGGIPKFMGGGGEGSNRAWQLDFRAAAVRRHTGGAGIVLLTATPAKNSPLEFYNLIQLIDPTAFTKAGIRDPEQFIDRFIKIEFREVLDSTFEVTKASAVTGFKNLDDLRTIIFTYGEFRTAAEVGLKLPRPIVETLTVQMDDAQEEKYARYVAEIERILANPNPEAGSNSNVIVGLLARLALVALHPLLDEGYSLKTALHGGQVKRRFFDESAGESREITVDLGRPVYESPKLTECAKRITASPHCGHIVFVEPTAVHAWMREVLVAHGIPRERIALLNSDVSTAERTKIARDFNGLSSEPPAPGTCARPSDSAVAPKYDVVIANSVAYEGIDLQVRTCSIHHLDLPWTPADLEQRNGRGVRQGNTLGIVNIFYYFADGSTDGYRFSLIDGKAGWLGQLIKSAVRDTNNPAAQQQLTPEDVLLMISRNKEKTRALLEDKRRRAAEEARSRIAREAARLLRQAVARFARARTTDDPDAAARLRDDAEQRLKDLEDINPEAWPWAPWIYIARDHDMIVPENGGAPVYEGLRIARPRVGDPGQLDFYEFGAVAAPGERATGISIGGQKITAEVQRIGLRLAGSATWQLIDYEGTLAGTPLAPAELPREGGPLWPLDDDERTAAALAQKFANLGPVRGLDDLGWQGASDAFLAKWWPRFADTIADAFARAWQPTSVPVVDEEGLAIAAGPEVRGARILPPTAEGWKTYLDLAPKSGESFTNLRDLGLAWWGRKIPPNLLAEARREREAEETEAPPPPRVGADEPPKAKGEAVSQETGTPATGTGQGTTPPRTGTPASSAEGRKPRTTTSVDMSHGTSSTGRAAARLAKGAAIEAAEHPEFPPAVAEQIAADHLRADPAHYDDATAPEAPEEKALYRCRRCGVRLDAPAEHVAIWADGKPVMCPAGANDFEKIPQGTPPDIIHLSAGAKARRAQAEAEELARIERIAGDDAGLRDLALQLGDLADPIEKTPREVADWFDAKGHPRIADWIHKYLDDGGPFGGLLEEIADLLRDSNDDDDVTQDQNGLIVPLDTIERDDTGRDYVVRQDPEGLARRYIKRLAPVLDEDGEETAFIHIRDADQAGSEGERLAPGDHLLNFHASRLDESFLRERWRHYQMLAKALRRAPLEIERTRQLLVYAAVLVRAPKCKGTARAAAKRALELAIREHRAAAEAFTSSGWTTSDFTPGKAVDRLARVARHLARLAHEVAQSCADGQILLATPEFAVPKDIPEDQDQPTPRELITADDDIYSDVTATALRALSSKPTAAATRTIEAALHTTLQGRRRA